MFVAFLSREFERRKKANPRYSIRAFARALKLESSTLSQILTRSRKITATQALRIVKSLDIDPAMKSTLLLAVIEGRSRPIPEDSSFTVASLDANGMEFWEFFAVLSLLELKGAVCEARWIAQRLGSTLERVSRCLSGLERQGYIRKERKGWRLAPIQLTTPLGCGSMAVVNAISEYILLGNSRLKSGGTDQVDFSGCTIAVNSKNLPEAIRRIKEFRRSLADFLSDEPKDSVYRLNLQLFRLDTGK